MKQIYSILSAALLVISCSRTEELYAPQTQGDQLVVRTEFVSSQPWATRSESQIYGEVSENLGDGEFVIYGTKEAFRTDSVPSSSGSIATRGTPIVSASGIANMRVNIFNTGTSNWSTSSTRTATLDATNVSGSFTTSPGYNWVTDAAAKTSLFAYSPLPSSTNGLTDVAPNKINYSIPSDVTKQPDLCVATPQMNIINDDGTQQVRTFALSHQLTAVGFTMLGWNLKITSITVSGVATAGTLTMNSSGTMSWSTSATGSRSVGVTGSSYQHTINSSYADITNSNGYLMMIPHTLSSSAQVTIAYTSTGTGSTSGTLTANLKDLGVTWEAGDRITYNIRLKTAPAVTSGDLTITTNKAGYTTSSPLTFLMDNKDNLTFTWSASWLKVHRGSPKSGDTSGGAVSGWSTGPGGPWNNIYFFATGDNTSEIADRVATVTVTGTRSGTKTFNVKQAKVVISNPINPPSSSDYVKIGSLYWTKGNLVATSRTANNKNSCKVGKPTDGGLYFQFGSLIGWKGGATANGGTGVGFNPYTGSKQFWNGASSWSWSNDAMVWPTAMSGTPSKWNWYGTSGTEHQWYFSGKGVTSGTINVTDPTKGVGDPCTYYLGSKWRLPTREEFFALHAAGVSSQPTTYGGMKGFWVGTNPGSASSSVFFPLSGYRYYYDGAFTEVSRIGEVWGSSVRAGHSGDGLFIYAGVSPDSRQDRTFGLAIRCVSTAP